MTEYWVIQEWTHIASINDHDWLDIPLKEYDTEAEAVEALRRLAAETERDRSQSMIYRIDHRYYMEKTI